MRIEHGDCREVMRSLISEGVQVDALVTDAPYHLHSIVKRFAKTGRTESTRSKSGPHQRTANGFMGKKWDGGTVAFDPETWRLTYDLLKPGAYALVFSGSRTFDMTGAALREAGFIMHPFIADLVACESIVAGFLESLTEAQAEAFVRCIEASAFGGLLGWIFGQGFPKAHKVHAEGWEGWRYGGQALKPAIEPILMAQKPMEGKNGTENVLKHGTGALNIAACRIGTEPRHNAPVGAHKNAMMPYDGQDGPGTDVTGRWPANVVTDGSEEVLAAFPYTESGEGAVKRETAAGYKANAFGAESRPAGTPMISHGDSGSAARFFYAAIENSTRPTTDEPKASNEKSKRFWYGSKADGEDRLGSKHPTVKPVDLMRYLVRLVTPPKGLVLDPFAGTGTTGMACMAEGFDCILIEREDEYVADIRRRIAHVSGLDGPLFRNNDTPPPPTTGTENLRRVRGRTIGPTGLKR